jgi:hypothetical protein
MPMRSSAVLLVLGLTCRPYTTIAPLVFVLGVSMVKEAVEDHKRGKQDREMNNRWAGRRVAQPARCWPQLLTRGARAMPCRRAPRMNDPKLPAAAPNRWHP